MLKVYHYPKCSTCKKAIAFLNDAGLDYEEVDIKVQPPTEEELQQMLDAYEGELRRLFNTSGMDYRAQGLKDKIPTMNKEEAFGLLGENGMLVKRPFLLTSDSGIVGFKEDSWKSFIAVS